MKKIIGIVALLVFVFNLNAQDIHASFDALLKEHVSSTGKVNYNAFKKDHKALKSYLADLAENPAKSNEKRGVQMAYWINLYNAATIDLILDNYPTKSILDLDAGKTWDVKRVATGGRKVSLNYIENDFLRPRFKDARIHFAVNCAAQSCPPLLNRAWNASNLEAYFEKQAKAFINNPKYNSISSKEVKISKIFEWYAGDFGNIIDYLNKYAAVKISSNAKVTYRDYDWALNK